VLRFTSSFFSVFLSIYPAVALHTHVSCGGKQQAVGGRSSGTCDINNKKSVDSWLDNRRKIAVTKYYIIKISPAFISLASLTVYMFLRIGFIHYSLINSIVFLTHSIFSSRQSFHKIVVQVEGVRV
jgi:hypothetical protein